MAYEFELTETLDGKFRKLEKRNKVLFMACRKKMQEIVQNPFHYKHLKYVDKFRVHVGGSFVIIPPWLDHGLKAVVCLGQR